MADGLDVLDQPAKVVVIDQKKKTGRYLADGGE
jgi:hypothetical protein